MKRKAPATYDGKLPIILDYYEKEDMLGKNVFTHFYFDNNELIIDSIHE